MNDQEKNFSDEYSNKKAAAYSVSQIVNTAAFQSFSLLTFTFYFAVVGINVILISIGFLIWSIWNSINDPMLGYLSDRTHTRWGRRYPYIMASIIPLAIIMILLFTPPIAFGITDELTNFAYFLIIIIIFELFFTMFDLNLISLFPELFITEEERVKANAIRMTFYIASLIIAFILPTLIIPDFSDPKYLREFQIFGIIVAIIIVIFGIIFLKVSPKERPEFKDEYKMAPGFITALKTCSKNKTFIRYVPAEVGMWFVIGMLTTIIPLYGKFVLGIGEGETMFLGLLLIALFISTAFFMNILWKPLVRKIGPRKSFLISLLIWVLTLAPLMFIQDRWQALIVFFVMGIGLSGPIYFVDLILADIIDEDEVNTKTRSEASYYGVKLFFIRLSTVFVFLTIALVFTNIGWRVFEPEKVTPQVLFGLRALMFIFPAIALGIAFLAVYYYPLHGERLKRVKGELQKIHEEKKSRI
jgi:GPH family glycoside/pentoside/hexuronide:cation symporter